MELRETFQAAGTAVLPGFGGPGLVPGLEGELVDAMKPAAERPFSDEAALRGLVDGCRAGDAAAMETVYRTFRKPVFGIIYRHVFNRDTAEDLLQDVFIKVFANMDNVRDVKTFPAWIYRIAMNACYSHLRHSRAVGGEPVSLDAVESAAGVESPGESGPGRDLKGAIDQAIAVLPQGLKQVFILHDVQGFKHEEIAGIVGCSSGTSKSQLFKARLRIRAFLKERQAV